MHCLFFYVSADQLFSDCMEKLFNRFFVYTLENCKTASKLFFALWNLPQFAPSSLMLLSFLSGYTQISRWLREWIFTHKNIIDTHKKKLYLHMADLWGNLCSDNLCCGKIYVRNRASIDISSLKLDCLSNCVQPSSFACYLLRLSRNDKTAGRIILWWPSASSLRRSWWLQRFNDPLELGEKSKKGTGE